MIFFLMSVLTVQGVQHPNPEFRVRGDAPIHHVNFREDSGANELPEVLTTLAAGQVDARVGLDGAR